MTCGQLAGWAAGYTRLDPLSRLPPLEAACLWGPAALLQYGWSGSVRRAVLVGGDVPLLIPFGENPGGSNQAFGGKFGLAGHENAAFSDDHGGVGPEEPDALRLVEDAGFLERPGEPGGHGGPDVVVVLLVDARLYHRRVVGVELGESVGVAVRPGVVDGLDNAHNAVGPIVVWHDVCLSIPFGDISVQLRLICGWLQAEPRSRSAWWTLSGDLGWLPPVECLIAGRVASVVSVLGVSHGWQAAWVPTGPTVEIHRSDR